MSVLHLGDALCRYRTSSPITSKLSSSSSPVKNKSRFGSFRSFPTLNLKELFSHEYTRNRDSGQTSNPIDEIENSEVEAEIQQTLYGMMEGKTVIAIAHRLSTISRMDREVVRLGSGRSGIGLFSFCGFVGDLRCAFGNFIHRIAAAHCRRAIPL